MMICIKLLVVLPKLPSNEIILREIPRTLFSHIHSSELTPRIESLKSEKHLFITLKPCSSFLCKDNSKFSFRTISLEFKSFSQPKIVFNMGNRKNRRTRTAESQSPDRDENTSFTK